MTLWVTNTENAMRNSALVLALSLSISTLVTGFLREPLSTALLFSLGLTLATFVWTVNVETL